MSGEFHPPAPAEEFPVQIFEGEATIAMPAEVTDFNSPDLKERMLELIAEDDLQTIVLDLENCGFVDASFLMVLVGSFKRASDVDKQLILRGAKHRDVSKIFEITGLDRVFKFEDGEQLET